MSCLLIRITQKNSNTHSFDFRKQTQFFKVASRGEAHKYEEYIQRLCNRNDGDGRPMPSIEHTTMHADKLAVVTCNNARLSEPIVRRYFVINWMTLTVGTDNSTILFIAGIHIIGDGSLGPSADIQILKNQVKLFTLNNAFFWFYD